MKRFNRTVLIIFALCMLAMVLSSCDMLRAVPVYRPDFDIANIGYHHNECESQTGLHIEQKLAWLNTPRIMFAT